MKVIAMEPAGAPPFAMSPIAGIAVAGSEAKKTPADSVW